MAYTFQSKWRDFVTFVFVNAFTTHLNKVQIVITRCTLIIVRSNVLNQYNDNLVGSNQGINLAGCFIKRLFTGFVTQKCFSYFGSDDVFHITP